MLTLARRVGEEIVIGDDIVITLVQIRGDNVRIGIKAPISVPVHRREVADAIARDGNSKAWTRTACPCGRKPRVGQPCHCGRTS